MKRKFIAEARPFWEEGQPLRAGEILYEHIRNQHRPQWAAEVLEICRNLIPAVPEVDAVHDIAKDSKRWPQAHQAFSAVRELTLRAERAEGSDDIYRAVLYVTENAAKVIYNASGEPAPFDHDSGWWLVANLRHIVDTLNDARFAAEAWRVVSCERYS